MSVTVAETKDEQDTKGKAHNGGQYGPFGFPLTVCGGEKLKESHIEHGASGKAHSNDQCQWCMVADEEANQCAKHGWSAA